MTAILSLGHRDHKEVTAALLGNRAPLVHGLELLLRQDESVAMKQGLGRRERYALEWRRFENRVRNHQVMHVGYKTSARLDNQAVGGFSAVKWRIC